MSGNEKNMYVVEAGCVAGAQVVDRTTAFRQVVLFTNINM